MIETLYGVQASAKLEKEFEEISKNTYLNGVTKGLTPFLKAFLIEQCHNSPVFAMLVFKTRRTLGDILFDTFTKMTEEMRKNAKDGVAVESDTQIYTEIMNAYFPGATVGAQIVVTLPDEMPLEDYLTKVTTYPEKKAPTATTHIPTHYEQPKPPTPEELEARRVAEEQRKLKAKEEARRRADEEKGQIFLFDM